VVEQPTTSRRRSTAALACVLIALVLAAYVVDSSAPADPPESAPRQPSRLIEEERFPPVSPAQVRRIPARTSESTVVPAPVQSQSLGVHVCDADRQALPSVALTLSRLVGGVLAAGVTAEGGECTLIIPGTEDLCVLEANAPGHATHRIDLQQPLPRRVEIVLERATSLEGRVVAFDGGLPSSSTRVVAWQSASMSARELAAGLSKQASVLSATVRSNGTFRIEGAQPQRRYSVMAGGGGWCSTIPQRAVAGTDGQIEITVAPLFGCVLEMQSDAVTEGYLLAGTRRFVPPQGVEGLESVSYPSVECLLAGVLEDGWMSEEDAVNSWARSRVIYAARTRATAVWGMGVEYDIPGHRKEVVNVDLPVLSSGWTTRRAQLPRTAIGFGSLRVRWLATTAISWLGARPWDVDLRIVMRPKSEVGSSFEIPIPGLGDLVNVGGVPLGVYDCRMESGWGWAYPRREWLEIDVTKNGAEVAIPSDGHGGVVIQPSRFDSSATVRRITLLMRRHPSGRFLAKSVSGPPFLAFGVPTGKYDVVAEVLRNSTTERIDCGTIVVTEGTWSTIPVVW
jgi:hypothetical protein